MSNHTPTGIRHRLPDFPDYEFDEDGVPYPIRQPRRGPRLRLHTPCPPNSCSRFQNHYLLRDANRRRVQKSQKQILAMIAEGSDRTEYFSFPEFPNTKFSSDGRAFTTYRNRECHHRITNDENGFGVRRYTLVDRDGRQHCVSDHTVRRVLAGKANFGAIEIPDHFIPLSGPYVDYAYDPLDRALYRISARKHRLYEPRRLKPGPGGQYNVADAEGKFRTRKLSDILRDGNCAVSDSDAS